MTRARVTRLAVATTAAVVAFVCVRALTREDVTLPAPPPAILGTWVTDDPRYAERAFVVRPDTIELYVGRGQALRHEILTIRESRAASFIVYEITYATTDGDTVLELLFYPDGFVRLEHPIEVRWVRGEPPR